MKARRTLAVIFSIVLSCMVFLPAALADEWNQATEMKFSEPLEIPGKVLPAGTYWFVLADNQGDRQTVQIFNADLVEALRHRGYRSNRATALDEQCRNQVRRTSTPAAGSSFAVVLPGKIDRTRIYLPGKSEQGLMRDAKHDIVAPTFSPNSSAMPGA